MTTAETSESTAAGADLSALASGLGRAINMVALYGWDHQITQATIDEVLPAMAPALTRRSRVLFPLWTEFCRPMASPWMVMCRSQIS